MKKIILATLFTLGMMVVTGCTTGDDANMGSKCQASGKCNGDMVKKCQASGKCGK